MHPQQSKPTHRSHHPLHDYTEPCIYHITLVCSDRVQMLGRMTGDSVETARVEFTPLGFDVFQAINEIPKHCAAKGRDVQILARAVMPEHIHFVLYVRQRLDVKLGLIIRGFKQGCNRAMRRWLEAVEHDEACGPRWREWAEQGEDGRDGGGGDGVVGDGGLGKPAKPDGEALINDAIAQDGGRSSVDIAPDGEASASDAIAQDGGRSQSGSAAFRRQPATPPCNVTAPSQSASPSRSRYASLSDETAQWFFRLLRRCPSERILQEHALFEEDFDETRLRRKGQLGTMIRYVHNNPTHRWLKQHLRERLRPVRGVMIGGQSYDAIGNLILLGLPRWQVWVRSRWDEVTRRNYKNNCILKARHGYALVSPFISLHESAVRDVALAEGHSVIVLTDNGMSDFTQCPGGLYDYCVNGQVLVLVPSELPHVERKPAITRQECVTLNDRACRICAAE